MTPEDPTNDEQEQVRRLLAASGGPAEMPAEMPAEVRARLDDVLAGLVAERGTDQSADDSPDEPTGAPVSLAARRRRRWPRVLVAAAAVSVLAYGAGTVGLSSMTGSGSDSLSSADSGSAADDAGGGSAESAGGDTRAPTAKKTKHLNRRDLADLPQSADGYLGAAKARKVPRLHSDTLRRDVRAAVGVVPTASRLSELDSGMSYDSRRAPRDCVLPDTRKGDGLVAVRLDGAPATLLLHRADGGTRVADVYSCDDGSDPVASTTLPAS